MAATVGSVYHLVVKFIIWEYDGEIPSCTDPNQSADLGLHCFLFCIFVSKNNDLVLQ